MACCTHSEMVCLNPRAGRAVLDFEQEGTKVQSGITKDTIWIEWWTRRGSNPRPRRCEGEKVDFASRLM
jgi:hypothetical protein